MHLTDAAGTTHRPAEAGFRIASLVPSITECLLDMGLVSHLVARTGFCVHPKGLVRDIPKVGGTKDVDLAKLRELAPTHVILNMDENRRETADALREFVPHLIVTHPRSPRDNLPLYVLLGGVFGCEAQAQALSEQLQAALDAVGEATTLPRRRVLYLIWKDPWMTVSRDTYIARMLELVNWQTQPEHCDTRYPQIRLEDFRDQADLLLLSSEPYSFREKHLSMVREHMGGDIDVRLIQGDMVSWYGSRAIAGIEYLHSLALRL